MPQETTISHQYPHLLSPVTQHRPVASHLAPLLAKFEARGANVDVDPAILHAECVPGPLRVKRKSGVETGIEMGRRRGKTWRGGDGENADTMESLGEKEKGMEEGSGGRDERGIKKPGGNERESIVRRMTKLFDKRDDVLVERRGTRASVTGGETKNGTSGLVSPTDSSNTVVDVSPWKTPARDKAGSVNGKEVSSWLLKSDGGLTAEKGFDNIDDVLRIPGRSSVPRPMPLGALDRSRTIERDGRVGYSDSDRERRVVNTAVKPTTREDAARIIPRKAPPLSAKELSRGLDSVAEERKELKSQQRDIKYAKDVFQVTDEQEWINSAIKGMPSALKRTSTAKSTTKGTGLQKVRTQESLTEEHPHLKCVHLKAPAQQIARRESSIADRIRLFDQAAKGAGTEQAAMHQGVHQPIPQLQQAPSHPALTSSVLSPQRLFKRRSEPMPRMPVDLYKEISHPEKPKTPDPPPRRQKSIIENPRRLSKLMDKIMLWENLSVSSVAESPAKSTSSTFSGSMKPSQVQAQAQFTKGRSNTASNAKRKSYLSLAVPLQPGGGVQERKSQAGMLANTGVGNGNGTSSKRKELDFSDINDVLRSLNISPIISPTSPAHAPTLTRTTVHKNGYNAAYINPTYRDPAQWGSATRGSVTRHMTRRGISYRNPFYEPNGKDPNRIGVNAGESDGADNGEDGGGERGEARSLAVSEADCRLLEPKPVRMSEAVRLMQLCAKFGQTVRLRRRKADTEMEGGIEEMF